MLTFGAASLGVSKALLTGGLDQPEAEGALTVYIDSLIEVDRDCEAAKARECSILPDKGKPGRAITGSGVGGISLHIVELGIFALFKLYSNVQTINYIRIS